MLKHTKHVCVSGPVTDERIALVREIVVVLKEMCEVSSGSPHCIPMHDMLMPSCGMYMLMPSCDQYV